MSTQTRVGAERHVYILAGHRTFQVMYGGETFTCFVLPLSMCPELPNFARQVVADDRTGITSPDDASVFGVCDSIPEKYRRYVALHEIVEYWEGNCCGESAKREIEAMRVDLTLVEQMEYISMRREFFTRLIPYATKHGYSAAKITEFQASLEIFNKTFP